MAEPITPGSSPGHILIVEDNPDDSELMTYTLRRKLGFTGEIHVANNASDASDYLNASGKYSGRDPSDMPALLILDVSMPGLDGFSFLGILRSNPRLSKLSVIIVSGSDNEADVRKGHLLGANSYFVKPSNLAQFEETFQRILSYLIDPVHRPRS